MQKIFYEKEIDLFHRLKELVSLTVDESIDYKMEEHGIRALGTLAIKGEYLSDEKKNFLENVELDIYADEQKIIDPQDFHLKVEDFHYDIQDGNLKIKIEVGVYGVEEGENRYIRVDPDPLEEIEALTRDLDEKKKEIKPQIEKMQVEEMPEKKVEELSEKESLLGSTYFENQKDLSMFILTWLYGFSQNACYQIEPQNQIITKEHYQFREFMIRRIEDE